MILAVLMSIGLIAAAVYFVNKMFYNDTQEILVKFILLVFTALVGVYVVDKVIAFKIALLSDSQDKDLFDLIKTLILMIFSYYFGTKKTKS
jgi:predicted anti-sigma-YlaC factor YlaD